MASALDELEEKPQRQSERWGLYFNSLKPLEQRWNQRSKSGFVISGSVTWFLILRSVRRGKKSASVPQVLFIKSSAERDDKKELSHTENLNYVIFTLIFHLPTKLGSDKSQRLEPIALRELFRDGEGDTLSPPTRSLTKLKPIIAQDRVKSRVKDPEVCDLLSPGGHVYYDQHEYIHNDYKIYKMTLALGSKSTNNLKYWRLTCLNINNIKQTTVQYWKYCRLIYSVSY